MLVSDKVSKTYNKENILNLNFYNFENEEASSSPYILTSPRSLKACSLANIKPIELLHRSASDIAKDLNLPHHNINHIYANYEQERQRKLETCKLVRKHIIYFCENDFVPKITTSSSPNLLSNRETTSRSSNYPRVDTPEYAFLRENKSRSSLSTSATPIPRYNLSRKEQNRSLRYSLSSSSSSVSSFNLNDKNCHQRSKSVECDKHKIISPKKLLKKNSSNKKKIEKHSKKIKNEIGKKFQMSEAERMNDQQLCWQIDNVKNSSVRLENTRNLKNAASVKENQTKKLKNKQNIIEQNNFITNCEKVINGTELQKIQKNKKTMSDKPKSKLAPKLSNTEFENSAKKSNDKFNESVKNNSMEQSDRKKQTEDDALSGLKDHDVRILDAMTLKRELQQSQENLAQRARLVWASTSNENVTPNLNSKIVNDKQKHDNCPFSENITFDTFFNHIRNKMKQLKEDSLHKELHGEHVRQLARELQSGMEQWQDQVLLLQWQALQRARTNAKLHIENKRLKTQCENNERALLHALRLKNIRNLERAKQISMKKEIQQKDCKIEKLKIKREREILDCKAQAHYTAELREQLRRTLTPQTFDQKVNDVMIKTRFTNRSLTASPFTESHIRLG